MATKPSKLPEWATTLIQDPVSGQYNVLEPPPEKKLYGWSLLEFPPRQWFNWLSWLTWLWLDWLKQQEEQAIVTDGNGTGLFVTEDALITLHAVDSTTPANYITATGYKATGVAPVLNVISSNVLTLGASTVGGDQAISGGTAGDIVVWGQSKKIA